MAVMLTLNLKKPDSSQFISEIQYGKDFWAFVIQKKTNLYLLKISLYDIFEIKVLDLFLFFTDGELWLAVKP